MEQHPEKLQEFDSRYADVEDGPETSFAVSNVVNTKSFEIKTPDVTIKVPLIRPIWWKTV